jgi:hypothetical protein
MRPAGAVSASVEACFRPVRQVRLQKPRVVFRNRSFSPQNGANVPFPRPEMTAYGRPFLHSRPIGGAGGRARKVGLRSHNRSSRRSPVVSLPIPGAGGVRVSGMRPTGVISASVDAFFRPVRQVRSQKPRVVFRERPFLPQNGTDVPFPRPEMTAYGRPFLHSRPIRGAGGRARKAGLRRPEGRPMKVPTMKTPKNPPEVRDQ